MGQRRSRQRNKVFAKHTVNGSVRCFYCGDDASESLTIDHVIPRMYKESRGLGQRNMVAACFSCNQAKASTERILGLLRQLPKGHRAVIRTIAKLGPSFVEWNY